MSNINELVYLFLEEIQQRFHQHIHKITIPSQRHIFAGQTVAKLAHEKNPALDNRKKLYRKLYLALKQREVSIYGSRAKSLSMMR